MRVFVRVCVRVPLCACVHVCMYTHMLPSFSSTFSQTAFSGRDFETRLLPLAPNFHQFYRISGHREGGPAPLPTLSPASSASLVRVGCETPQNCLFFFFPGGHTYLFVRSYSLLIPEIFIKVSSSIFQLVEAVISP